MTAETAEKLKKTELEILKAFIKICDENKLQYYLIGGSAIGAIRHNGFIPWDDDIDVGMPRKDYNIFLRTAQHVLPDYYFLQTFETDSGYLANFAKIRDSRTTFIESSVKNQKMNHGIYIDIFPLDYYPEKNIRWFKFIELLQKARISAEFSSKASKKMKVVQVISRFIYPNLAKTLKQRDNHIQSISSSSKIVNVCGAWGDKEICPATFFGKGTLAAFEDIMALVPENYDGYLRNVYGDYMTPPPVEERFGHHRAEIIDCEKPYTEYMK